MSNATETGSEGRLTHDLLADLELEELEPRLEMQILIDPLGNLMAASNNCCRDGGNCQALDCDNNCRDGGNCELRDSVGLLTRRLE